MEMKNNIFFILKTSLVANLYMTKGMKGQENSLRLVSANFLAS
jgi:hypothetical protein